jgi:shikimate kinase
MLEGMTTTDGPVPRRILLVGMMGAGKTTIAREIATRTGWPAVDNDDLVRSMTGREPAAIAIDDGEDALHDAEADALTEALDRIPPLVVGVAGAMVDRPDRRAMLRRGGHVVWLRARPATLHERIGAGSNRRPDAADLAWLSARALEREPLYLEVANQVIDVDGLSPNEIATMILDPLAGASDR